MAKVILGSRPDTVSLKVKFEHLDGTKDVIRIDYIYRTRREFAEFIDANIAQARTQSEQNPVIATGDVGEISQVQWIDKLDSNRADYLMQIMQGWDLPQTFDRSNVLLLIDEYPQVVEAITQAYRQAISEGRSGN
ncbi:MAG: phage tail assembly chaperone [Corticimicrobacter sp.]|uniref:phage tail assembly chaperone n=1 Tax=Corticimicrobacter sp. TaxID=2678536 RepID=UPI0032DBB11F